MSLYLDVVKAALDEGIRVRCHVEDVTHSDMPGFTIPFAIELVKLRQQYGVDVKVRLCDTMGYGVPWPNATLPRSVPKIVHAMIHDAGVPSELLEWHGHNDFHKVLINPATAWLYGCAGCNASILGIGERTGNTPLEAMVIEYAQLRGTLDGMDTTAIDDIAKYFERELGYRIPDKTPFVGRDFNVTRAGIHADGLLKDEEIYNIFDTAKILNRPPMVAISNTSGTAGIAVWLSAQLQGEKIDKKDERVAKLKNWVDEQYAAGRQTAIGNDELCAVGEALGIWKQG